MREQDVTHALADARAAAGDIQAAQQTIRRAAQRRQQAILRAAEAGWSVRRIAADLGCSPAVIQAAISAARDQTEAHPST